MKIQRYCLILLLSAFSTFCFSQAFDSVQVAKKSSNLVLSYNSSIIYPGARFGFEFPVYTIYKNTVKKSGIRKDYMKDRFITAQLSWYHHPAFHDNYYLTAGWTMRRTKSTGFFTEFSPEIGFSRTFLGGTTYQVDESGNVTIKKLAGYFYALASVGGGIGYDFSKTKQKPFLVLSKLNLLAMFPYNSTIYLRPTLEIGFIYKPAHFIPLKVKSKNRIK
jgi:hypothetical protein